jgi:hypothetical protein
MVEEYQHAISTGVANAGKKLNCSPQVPLLSHIFKFLRLSVNGGHKAANVNSTG